MVKKKREARSANGEVAVLIRASRFELLFPDERNSSPSPR